MSQIPLLQIPFCSAVTKFQLLPTGVGKLEDFSFTLSAINFFDAGVESVSTIRANPKSQICSFEFTEFKAIIGYS